MLTGLCFFYQKIILPSVVFSVMLSLMFQKYVDFFTGAGISFMILLPVMQYLTYEIRKPGEYFFYYNLGLSKLILWITTISISAVSGISIALI
ncbi:hypothetical protein SAMN06265348_103478 [Pedobacter westerhofensis]|uniref:Amino acid transporter transmembrane domain-containing protein n=1 Tax=Pedobacter westerhofensis TaxID=425512 RepID=A0A521CDG7_9SPHI|nr:hypothetical protein SAMN06265348_103478 [Pedobacter westerhofensis]